MCALSSYFSLYHLLLPTFTLFLLLSLSLSLYLRPPVLPLGSLTLSLSNPGIHTTRERKRRKSMSDILNTRDPASLTGARRDIILSYSTHACSLSLPVRLLLSISLCIFPLILSLSLSVSLSLSLSLPLRIHLFPLFVSLSF